MAGDDLKNSNKAANIYQTIVESSDVLGVLRDGWQLGLEHDPPVSKWIWRPRSGVIEGDEDFLCEDVCF
jgi:hypothetical protein